MAGLKPTIIRGGLESLYFTGAHLVLRPLFGGVGAILTLHHVRPPRPDRFQPNRLLEVTPRFLTGVVKDIRRSGRDIVSLDEMHRRLTEGDFARRFVCLTFDDGYRDTMQWAYPILKEAAAPFAVYVPTSFPDRLGELWWLVLEAVIARNNRVGLVIDGRDRMFECGGVAEKRALYDELYWWLRGQPSEAEMHTIVRSLAAFYHVDVAAFCDDLCMTWPELAGLAADPLVTIGAHTVNHPMLAKLPKETARAEMELSASVIEAALAVRPQHLSYPVWRPGLGRRARVRTRRRSRFQDRRHDAAGRAVSRPQPASFGAAAHFAQRRLSAPALCAGAAVGRRDRDVERLSPLGRRLIGFSVAARSSMR